MKDSNQLKSEKKMVLAVLVMMLVVVNAFMLYISYSKAKTNVELIASQIVSVINTDIQNNSSIASSLGAMLQLPNNVINKTLNINVDEAIKDNARSINNNTLEWNGNVDIAHRKKFTILRSFWRSYSGSNKSRFSTYYTDGDSGYYYNLADEKVIAINGSNPHFRLTGYIDKTSEELKNSHGFMVPELFYSNVYIDSATELPAITIGVPVIINNFSSQVSKISGIIATDYTSEDLRGLLYDGFKELNARYSGYDISIHSVQPNDIPMNIFSDEQTLFGFEANHISLTKGYYINARIHLLEMINARWLSFLMSNLMMAFFFLTFLKAHRNSAMMMGKLTTDSLTKTLSREGGRILIEQLKHQQGTALVVIDLNDFKIINDTYGHQTGDEALVYFSRYMMDALRQSDALIRMGGDEFLLLMPNTTVERAQEKLTKLEQGLRSFPHEKDNISLSFSFGVSEVTADFNDSYKKADQNLYQMKKEKKASR